MLKPTVRATRLTAIAAATLLTSLPLFSASHSVAAQAQSQSRSLGPNNISVSGRFLAEWSKQGSEQASVYVNGYPITPRRAEISLEDGKSYDTQWFERARYEAHPEKAAPYDVLLGRLGATLAEGRGTVDPATNKARNASDAPFMGIDNPAGAGGKGKAWFQETRHSVSGKVLDYWNRYGGLSQFGFPLSEAFEEASPTDGKTYTVQYFERNRFELHPGNPPPYDVELGLLGVQQYKLQPIPADELPIAPPKGVTSSKDTLVQGSQQEPTDLVGFETNTVVAQRFLDAITFQDALVHGDDRGNYFPLAAWYVPTVENGGSYYVGTGDDRHLVTKYKLRHGVKWADGQEVTSNDALFYYSYLLSDPNALLGGYLKKLSSVENPDRYTILYNWLSYRQAQAKLNQPDIDKRDYSFLNLYIQYGVPVTDKQYFLIGGVLPEHVLSKVRPDKVVESDYARNPMGYGPYRVQEWKQHQQMTLIANENYNLTAPPLIKRIISKYQPSIVDVASQFTNNSIDAIAGEDILVPPDQTPQIIQAGGKVDAVPAASWEHLEPYFGYAPFQDKRVR